METRESLARKRANWMNQKAYANNHHDYDENKKVNREDIMAELVGKMNGMVIDQQPGQQKIKKQEIRFEKTFAREMESHTCPICFEMMLPPNNPPMILFPCGHTFCKGCIIAVEKNTHNPNNRNKCCLCKGKFVQKAVNIALQNLICIFTDNRQLLTSNLIEEELEKVEEKKESIGLNNVEYENRLRDQDLRLRIMVDEKQKMEIEVQSLKTNLYSVKENQLVYKEKSAKVEKKIKQYTEQQDVLENYIVSGSQQITDKEGQILSLDEKVCLLKDTISSLETERIKVNLLQQELKK